MNKKIIIGLFVGLVSATPFLASAVVMMPPPVPPPEQSPRVCGLLSRNLSRGSQGDDVRGLQEFLLRDGYLQASATGYFGPMTARAVSQWQSAEGIQRVGAFGPLSRARLKIRCGGNGDLLSVSPNSGTAPLTVIVTSKIGDSGGV